MAGEFILFKQLFFSHDGINRYPGIHCCPKTEYPTVIMSPLPSLGSSLSPSSFLSDHTESPSSQLSITTLPSSVPSSNPSDILSLGPSGCYQCDDRVSPLMEEHGEHCETSDVLLRIKCKHDEAWSENTYCEHSCFFFEKGINRYPDIWCCEETQYPTIVPSSLPSASSFPFIQPTPCTECTNIASPELIAVNEDCHISYALLETLCHDDIVWTDKRYCEYACHDSGNDYDGTVCCKQTEYPSAKPSGVPSTFFSHEPSSVPSSLPSIQPSTAFSSFPSTVPSSVPSKYASRYPSRSQSLVPSVEPSNNPSSFPSYSPSYSNQPTACVSCSDIESPEMITFNETCGAVKTLLHVQCHTDVWLEEKYCQYSCHAQEDGYPGDHCCAE